MNFISNDYSVRAPPVTIVPTSAGSTVLDLQPDLSLRTIGRSTASRSTAVQARNSDPPRQDDTHSTGSSGLATAEDNDEIPSRETGRPRSSVDLYRSTQRNAGSDHAFHRIDLYA